MIWVVVGFYVLMFVMLGVAMFSEPGGGSWVKDDGTIIEWDGDGHGRVLHPNGKLDEY